MSENVAHEAAHAKVGKFPLWMLAVGGGLAYGLWRRFHSTSSANTAPPAVSYAVDNANPATYDSGGVGSAPSAPTDTGSTPAPANTGGLGAIEAAVAGIFEAAGVNPATSSETGQQRIHRIATEVASGQRNLYGAAGPSHMSSVYDSVRWIASQQGQTARPVTMVPAASTSTATKAGG